MSVKFLRQFIRGEKICRNLMVAVVMVEVVLSHIDMIGTLGIIITTDLSAECNRNDRDGARSSRDSRSDHRRAENEHSRPRNDSNRHSRDKYRVNSNEKGEDLSSDRAVSGRRHTYSRVKDKEKDCGKRGSHWTFGDRHSRDKKELEDPEVNKEKDVHVKYPRDRPDDATESRDTYSKKLKGFVSENFTMHGSTNEEKHTSRFKSALGSGNQSSSLQSHSKEAEVSGDVDAAKVAAMQAAE